MRIGLNLLYLIPNIVGGTEEYAAGLLAGLAGLKTAHEFVVFVNEEGADWPIPSGKGFTRVVCPVRALNRGKRYFYEQAHLPRQLAKYKLDLIHSLGYVGPIFLPCPGVVTVPDVNFWAIGHTMPSYKRLTLNFFSTQSIKRAAAVVTISDFSKKSIVSLGIAEPAKIQVTPLGPRGAQPELTQKNIVEIQHRYGLVDKYWAAFGGSAIHKNISRLLQAYARLGQSMRRKLLLLGHLPPDVKTSDLTDGVVATGYVPAEHVLPLLAGAEMFILPSLYEGFGLPVLEAQQVGVPVVCSSAGSLPEVAGDAAVYFQPESIDDMCEKIAIVAQDSVLRNQLRQKGVLNLQRFSWEKTAIATLSVYEGVEKQRRLS